MGGGGDTYICTTGIQKVSLLAEISVAGNQKVWRGFRSGTFTGDTETRFYSLKMLILRT